MREACAEVNPEARRMPRDPRRKLRSSRPLSPARADPVRYRAIWHRCLQLRMASRLIITVESDLARVRTWSKVTSRPAFELNQLPHRTSDVNSDSSSTQLGESLSEGNLDESPHIEIPAASFSGSLQV
jgi:hypothetical protein